MSNAATPVEGKAPIAPKALAGTLGSGIGGTLGTAIVYVIGIFCPGGSFDASTVDKTIAAVPWPLAGLIPGAVAAAGALIGTYYAPHQARLADVTEALARYTVGVDELAPAAHDVDPAPEPVVTPLVVAPLVEQDVELDDIPAGDAPVAGDTDEQRPPDAPGA